MLRLVRDFAGGLGCAVDERPGEVRIELSDTSDGLLELLDYIALSTTKAGVEFAEPLCRVTYRRGDAAAQVTLDLRIAGFSLAGPHAAV